MSVDSINYAVRAIGPVGGRYDFGLAGNMPIHFQLGSGDRAVYIYHDLNQWIIDVRFWKRHSSLYYGALSHLYDDLRQQYLCPHDKFDDIELFFDKHGNTLRLLAMWEEHILKSSNSPFDLGNAHRRLMNNVTLTLHAGAQGPIGLI